MDFYIPRIAHMQHLQTTMYSEEHLDGLYKTEERLLRTIDAFAPKVYNVWQAMAKGTRVALGKAIIVAVKERKEHAAYTAAQSSGYFGKLTRVKRDRLRSVMAGASPDVFEKHCQTVLQVLHEMKHRRTMSVIRKQKDIAATRLSKRHSKYIVFTGHTGFEYWRAVNALKGVKKNIRMIAATKEAVCKQYTEAMIIAQCLFADSYVDRDDGDECPICLEDACNQVRTTCGHYFHPMCIMQYIHSRTTRAYQSPVADSLVAIGKLAPCPMCRSQRW